MEYKKLSIVIPVWNEENTITNILSQLINLSLPKIKKEIIVVNDGSTDNTAQELEKFADYKDVKVLHNEENMGKTQTVKRGILESTGDLVVVQDADLEYDPKDLIKFVRAFQQDPKLDAAYGNRFHPGNEDKGPNYFGNLFLTWFSNLFTGFRGFKVNDMEVCYKMIKGKLFRQIADKIETTSMFGLEPEVTARLAKNRAKVKSIDISYKPRGAKEGKKMKAIKHGLAAVKEIVKYNLGK